MKYLSLFSGIEAATVAWKPLGWTCVGVAEIEPTPCALLAKHYPDVPNLGDITKITEADIIMLGHTDLVVFGSPCQDLSVAGKRKGLEGARSGLFHIAMRIVGWLRKHCGLRWALWENVPGAFTSNEGADFAIVVGTMAGCTVELPEKKKWGNEGCVLGEEAMVEWATLDAQWFGVAQRRRRVFALADFGDWTSRGPILLEPESLRGDSAPCRGSREEVAGTLAARTGGSDENDAANGRLIAEFRSRSDRLLLTPSTGDVAHCLNAGGMGRIDYETETMVVCATGDVTHTLKADGFDASEDGTVRGTPVIAYMPARTFAADGGVEEHFAEREVCDALHTSSGSGNKAPIIAFDSRQDPVSSFEVFGALGSSSPQAQAVAFQSSQSGIRLDDVHATLDSNNGSRRHNGVLSEMRVRRLTPRECERLQAFPDDYTAATGAKDGPRYKALGNSMCVNVMHWIGHRIDFVNEFF